MLKEAISIVFHNLSERKLRSFLTVLSVIIGVAAVVGLIGSVEGIKLSIERQLQSFRSDWIIILPGKLKMTFGIEGRGGVLTMRDTDLISKVEGVEVVSPILQKTLLVSYKEEKVAITVMGVDPDKFKQIDTLGIYEGRYLTSREKYSAVLGYGVGKEIFEEEVGIRKKIEIEGKKFTVVGIRNKYGGYLGEIEDVTVFIPIETMREEFFTDEKKVSMIIAKVKVGEDIEEVASRIKMILCKEHKSCGDEDFTVVTPQFVQSTISQITFMLTVLLGGIAGISLLVGGIGIANTMYTSVMERTREIGTLKAIGATSKTIMLLFLLESGFMGLLGGIIGCVFGIGIGETFLWVRRIMISKTEFVKMARGTLITHVRVTPQLILTSLTFSFIIGVISGLLPARKAAKLQPVEALRYE